MKYLTIKIIGIGILMSCCGKESGNGIVDKKDSIAHAKLLNYIADSSNCTNVVWLDTVYKELGKVKEGELLELSWRFKNTGTKPFIIANVATSCGCTVADKPKEEQ
jgi:hypothetical protein